MLLFTKFYPPFTTNEMTKICHSENYIMCFKLSFLLIRSMLKIIKYYLFILYVNNYFSNIKIMFENSLYPHNISLFSNWSTNYRFLNEYLLSAWMFLLDAQIIICYLKQSYHYFLTYNIICIYTYI